MRSRRVDGDARSRARLTGDDARRRTDGRTIVLNEDGPISTRISNFGFNTSRLYMLNTFELNIFKAIDSSMRLVGAAAGEAIATAAFEARDGTCTSLSEAV